MRVQPLFYEDYKAYYLLTSININVVGNYNCTAPIYKSGGCSLHKLKCNGIKKISLKTFFYKE